MDPVWSRIVDNVTRNGDRPALEVGGDIVSYRDLYADAARIGATLTHPSTAILGQRTREGYAAVLGTVLRGATYVPLGTAFPVADNVHRLELVRCESLIVDATGLSALPALLEGLSRAITVLVLAEADIAELRVVHRRHRLLGRHDLAPAEGFEP
ncbi:MAG: AMP-binding protein, partial [Myxococcota bacterium]